MSFTPVARTLCLALSLSLVASLHAQTYTVESGKTTVALSADLVSAFKTLGVTPGTIGPTTISKGVATFPAVAGAVSLNNLRGQILHSGGLTLADSNARVRLQSYIIDTTGSRPVITGLVTVNGVIKGRMRLFDVSLPSGITFPLKPTNGDMLALSNLSLTLDAAAADALNKVFSVSAFTGGLRIGTARVSITVYEDAAK